MGARGQPARPQLLPVPRLLLRLEVRVMWPVSSSSGAVVGEAAALARLPWLPASPRLLAVQPTTHRVPSQYGGRLPILHTTHLGER